MHLGFSWFFNNERGEGEREREMEGERLGEREREREFLRHASAKYFEDCLRFLAHEWVGLSCTGLQFMIVH